MDKIKKKNILEIKFNFSLLYGSNKFNSGLRTRSLEGVFLNDTLWYAAKELSVRCFIVSTLYHSIENKIKIHYLLNYNVQTTVF